MNLERLKRAEEFFLTRYPGGFSHPEMVAIGKKTKDVWPKPGQLSLEEVVVTDRFA